MGLFLGWPETIQQLVVPVLEERMTLTPAGVRLRIREPTTKLFHTGYTSIGA